jgi:hypothetical protein
MTEDNHPGSIEFELLEQELYALIEVEQATLLRSLALPVGYEKSQALAEYSNAVAAVSALQQRRERFLLSAIRELMYPKLPVPECRGIGFTADLEKKP